MAKSLTCVKRQLLDSMCGYFSPGTFDFYKTVAADPI